MNIYAEYLICLQIILLFVNSQGKLTETFFFLLRGSEDPNIPYITRLSTDIILTIYV